MDSLVKAQMRYVLFLSPLARSLEASGDAALKLSAAYGRDEPNMEAEFVAEALMFYVQAIACIDVREDILNDGTNDALVEKDYEHRNRLMAKMYDSFRIYLDRFKRQKEGHRDYGIKELAEAFVQAAKGGGFDSAHRLVTMASEEIFGGHVRI